MVDKGWKRPLVFYIDGSMAAMLTPTGVLRWEATLWHPTMVTYGSSRLLITGMDESAAKIEVENSLRDLGWQIPSS